MLTVIAAMDLELAPLRRALRSRYGVAGSDPHLMGSGLAMDLQVIGVDRKRAMARVKEMVSSRHRPSGPEDGSGQRLLLLGFAGAVDPSLRPGELSLPARHYVAQQGNDERGHFLEPDQEMWRQAETAAAQAGLAVARGSSLTLDYVAATPEVKAALREKYPVDVVNMEDYWVAEAARDAGVPFLSVRAVLDSAHHSLPSYLMGLTENRATAVLGTVGMPWRWATLWGLAQQTRRARRTLTRFALSYIHYERLASTATGDRRALLFAGDVPREAQAG
jgi:nucleoside phosphorylase